MNRKYGYGLIAGLIIVLVTGTVLSFRHLEIGGRAPSLTDEATQATVSSTHKKSPRKLPEEFGSYTIPAADKKNEHFVSSGNLLEVGRYTVSALGLKTELVGQYSMDKKLDNGDICYHVTNVQLLRNVPRTKAALKNAQVQLNDDSLKLKKAFTTLKITYQVRNDTDNTVMTNGLSTVTFNNGRVASEIDGLNNDRSLSTVGIQAGDSRVAYATVEVDHEHVQKLKTMTLQFSSVTNSATGEKVVDTSKNVKLSFE